MDDVLHRIFRLKPREHLIDLLTSRTSRHAISAALALAAAGLAWSLFHGASKPTDSAPNLTIQLPNRDQARFAQDIAAAHLFGQSSSEMPDTPQKAAYAVKIDGLLYSSDPESAWAILQVDGTSGIYKTGDTLPDGETVAAIAETAVQLADGMSQRVIELQRDFGNATGILLAGDTGLMPSHRALFPGEQAANASPSFAPALQAVSLPQNADPLTQLRSLRQQLIQH
jgi:hypothetical protein